ncbi:hypothetical protein MTO96_037805 [Rhipicephalus appendiculatus]
MTAVMRSKSIVPILQSVINLHQVVMDLYLRASPAWWSESQRRTVTTWRSRKREVTGFSLVWHSTSAVDPTGSSQPAPGPQTPLTGAFSSRVLISPASFASTPERMRDFLTSYARG